MSKLGFLRNVLPDIDDYSYEKLCSFATFESCSSKNSPGKSEVSFVTNFFKLFFI